MYKLRIGKVFISIDGHIEIKMDTRRTGKETPNFLRMLDPKPVNPGGH